MEGVELWTLRVLHPGHVIISVRFGNKQNDHLQVKILGYVFNIVYTFKHIPSRIL